MKPNKIGVIGAGVMGIGLAQTLAQFNYPTILIDVSDPILKRAREAILKNIRFSSLFNRDQHNVFLENIIEHVVFTTDYSKLADVDFVIESTTEKWDVKEVVFRQLDNVCTSTCKFASNTSAISVTRIASLMMRPENVVGIHFMNPVPLKPVVEVIKGHHTSEATLQTAKDLLESLDKNCIVVNDMPGFVSNRVLMLTINEAIFVLQDQVASAKDIDSIFKLCFGHKMGPLETADLIGLDTILYSLEVLYESFGDGKFRPCPLLKKMVYAGLLGQKTGEGFHKYLNA